MKQDLVDQTCELLKWLCNYIESYTKQLLESSSDNIPSFSWPNHRWDVVKWSFSVPLCITAYHHTWQLNGYRQHIRVRSTSVVQRRRDTSACERKSQLVSLAETTTTATRHISTVSTHIWQLDDQSLQGRTQHAHGSRSRSDIEIYQTMVNEIVSLRKPTPQLVTGSLQAVFFYIQPR